MRRSQPQRARKADEGEAMPRGRPRKDAACAVAARSPKTSKANGNGVNLGFEAQLFLAADKLRKNLEPSDYRHVTLGLIFLKHISNAFEAKRTERS
jgi:type I restriction enzyme M protein